jgi:hypothetical protein
MRRALREIETEDCKWGHCYRCGIPGDGADTRLAPRSLPVLSEPAEAEWLPAAPAYRRHAEPRTSTRPAGPPQEPVHRRYRVAFSKTGDARFLSHRQVMDTLERSLRAIRAPARFTEGFNPHIRLSMGPALPVGYEGLAEAFDVDCTAPLRQGHLEAANLRLPEGLQLLEARDLLPGAPSLGKLAATARYRIGPLGGSCPERTDAVPEPVRGGIRSWVPLSTGMLRVELNLRQDEGPTPSVHDLLAAIGVPEAEIPVVRVARERVVLRARERVAQAPTRVS